MSTSILFSTVLLILYSISFIHCKSFTIDYDNNTYLKDGKPFRYISGSIHYFRSPEQRWNSLLRKMRLGGLNAITTYVPWNIHQPHPDLSQLDFNGGKNLFKFLQLAQRNDLLVILRPSPFIDAEWDMGGLPAWLLWEKPGIKIRSSDLEYNYYVSRWYDELLPRLVPYLYVNGGPIIAMQVENEYGSYGCDAEYKVFLRDLMRHHLGEDIVLFTNDGAGDGYMRCGNIPEVYATLDFGPGSVKDINASFTIQRKYSPKGPLVNSEFYPGWLDHWQKPHSKSKPSVVAQALDHILSFGANVNIYMYHGGTSFGYTAGSNMDGNQFDPCPTSYDYDAPLTESGNPTEKYHAIKEVIAKYIPVPHDNPVTHPASAYGKVRMQPYTRVHDQEFLALFSKGSVTVSDAEPLSFEQLKISSGFVLYQSLVNFKPSDPVLLSAPELRDRGYVYVNEQFVGILSRSESIYSLPLRIRLGQTVSILVENQGRVCFGSSISESKGLGPNVTLGSHKLTSWTIFPLGELDGKKLQKYSLGLKEKSLKNDLSHFLRNGGSGHFFVGNFSLPQINSSSELDPADTYLRLDGFNKGIAWINGINLGRYWPVVGPQETLYIPSPFLKSYPQTNTLILFELEEAPTGCLVAHGMRPENGYSCFITLTDKHVIDAPTPYQERHLVKGYSRQDWLQ